MSTRLQIVDTRPRVLPQAVHSPVEDLVAGFQSAFNQARAQHQQAEQIAQERAFRKEMQRLGFEHEDRARGETFRHEDTRDAAQRIFEQQSQERLFGHENTARRETFNFQGKENEANRGVTREGQAIQREGIANERDLGMRRLSIDAMRAGAEAQHYRAQDAAHTATKGLNASGLVTLFGQLNSRIAGGLDPSNPADVERFQRTRALIENGRVYPAGRGALLPANVAGPPVRRGEATPHQRLSAEPAGGGAAPAARDSVAEQQAHWDEAAAALRNRGVKDVEGTIGSRPLARR
jgi:hypothetical protein